MMTSAKLNDKFSSLNDDFILTGNNRIKFSVLPFFIFYLSSEVVVATGLEFLTINDESELRETMINALGLQPFIYGECHGTSAICVH